MSTLKPIGKRRKRRGSNQKRAIKEFLQGAGWNCWHCGMHISYRKASNAAHKYPKGRYPEKACDVENLIFLCSALDVNGRRSCHDVYDGGSLQEWEQLRDSEHPMENELRHRSELEYQPVT